MITIVAECADGAMTQGVVEDAEAAMNLLDRYPDAVASFVLLEPGMRIIKEYATWQEAWDAAWLLTTVFDSKYLVVKTRRLNPMWGVLSCAATN